MSKFTIAQKLLVNSIVASLTIKRIPNNEIIKEIERQTGKTVSRMTIGNVRRAIKRESKKWYETLREGEYEYIHEFKERINEIVDLQRRHYKIIEENSNNPSIQQTSLAELHRLNITLSNYFDVAPTIVSNPVGQNQNQNDSPVSISPKDIIV